MKQNKIILLLVFFLTINLSAQEDNKEAYQDKKNIGKIFVSNLFLRGFQFQYERVINKSFSAAATYGFTPEGSIPMLGSINSLIDDQETEDILNDVKYKKQTFLLEFRWYLGKGYGKGFYLAPFYQYSKHEASGVNFEYTQDDTTLAELETSGSITGNTFGLLIGAQFNLGKSFVLDWWILGPSYGSSSGNLAGNSSRKLSPTEQAALQNELSGFEIPFTDSKVSVNENGGNIDFDGPWANIRAGLAIGFRF